MGGVSEYDIFMLKQQKAVKENKIAAFGYEVMMKAANLGFNSIEEYVKFIKECHTIQLASSTTKTPE
jgi:DNA integrity scanning protein DisA with diadenylate cyclase activity